MNGPAPRTYLIEPLAPVIVRSGRPFDSQTGPDSARFPPPSTLAGALRTAHAESKKMALGVQLAAIPVAGPLPVRIDEHGSPVTLLVPKPADAHYLRRQDRTGTQVFASRPLPLAPGEGMDLPDPDLIPVQLSEAAPGKPATGPRWWSLSDFHAFRRGQVPTFEALEANGWSPPADDLRTHVAIDRSSQATADGQLFQTSGVDFVRRNEARTRYGQRVLPADRIGILGRVDGDIDTGVIHLGGERRLAAIAPAPDRLWPDCPASWIDDVRRCKGLCLTLLTPALFAAGWRPAWSKGPLGTPPGCEGLQLLLRAAALDRWQPHSGWDLVLQKPRAGRKLVPAGAVYWFEVLNASTAPEAALRALWTISISDHDQDRRDGFGLVLPSVWNPPLSR